MGAGQSNEHGASSPEELSSVLAERFATKCFSPLELAHFKDNFFSRALEQGGLRYWNEKVLSDFLGIPDGIYTSSKEQSLDAGPVIFRMVSYLGAFPFQNTLAPSVLTFEAMVKVVVLLTERYGKALKRGHKDRTKLLFGSLADVGRKTPANSEGESITEESGASAGNSHALGFSIDEPANDEYDEDEDDDLALAALESLDAIEVFKHDHRVDKTVYETRISIDTFRRLLMLLLVIAPLKPLESLKVYTSGLDGRRMELVKKEADSIIAAFSPEESDGGITYKAFARTISLSLPYLFDPLTALFEHMLFSKNLNLSQRRQNGLATESEQESKENEELPLPPAALTLPGSFESAILNPTLHSHLSFFLPSTSPDINILRSDLKLHPVFSTSAHGSSLTYFSHHVLTWQSATLLILQGSLADSSSEELVTLGAYIPQPWKTSISTSGSSSKTSDLLPCLFQLSPKHMLLPGNPSPSATKPNTPTAYFSPNTGIAIGCKIPAPSRTNQTYPSPHGAGSLIIDANIETAEFHAAPFGHNGVFLPAANTSPEDPPTKIKLDLYTLEIWGIVPDPDASFSADPSLSPVEIQRAKWEFEAREAERRRNINIKAGAGDPATESARWLLEAAGIVGDQARYAGGGG
ncbi:TLDc [Penicillium concentricum]|uniref:TLDc n=1 Tax=Penicillium concentricum TaxID=293559 RepID=A0A9W9SB42_9EURO|nr:TLDc [Penicillium concentricum]KAJ5373909.1 TLDc [Penicillium concentricum]